MRALAVVLSGRRAEAACGGCSRPIARARQEMQRREGVFVRLVMGRARHRWHGGERASVKASSTDTRRGRASN